MPAGVYSIFAKRPSAASQVDEPPPSADPPVRPGRPKKVKDVPPVVLDSPPKKRKKPVAPVASTSQPKAAPHPFFTKPATAAAPIVVPDSPLRPESTFAERERQRRERFFAYKPYEARWPDATDHHVRGDAPKDAREPVAGPSSLTRKGKERVSPIPDPPISFRQLGQASLDNDLSPFSRLTSTPNTLTPADIEALLPADRDGHPLLARLASLALDRSQTATTELWTHKYAPSTTGEFLGDVSGASAATLRAWLLELAIKGERASAQSGAKSPRKRQVVRKVQPKKRQKKRGDLDDFIAHDGAEDDADPILDFPPDYDDDLSLPPAHPPSSHAGPTTPRQPELGRYKDLTNLILLRGPAGSGKTSVVYAAARELGFEVFELSPGGRRSGRDLEAAVSGVSTEHLVSKGKQAAVGGTSPRRPSFFGAIAGTKKSRPVVLDSDDVVEETVVEARKPAEIKQSLILLEEVDVLFPDDKGFWEALVQLVSRSRRPIVMTCTDDTRLDLKSLPVQDTLLFEPPPRDVALAYLRLVALAEGHVLPLDVLEQLYAYRIAADPSHPPSAIGPTPLPPTPRARLPPTADLRHALMQLQLLCSSPHVSARWQTWTLAPTPRANAHGVDAEVDLERRCEQATGFAEARSMADAYVDRRPAMAVEDLDGDVAAEGDVEVGDEVLRIPVDPLRHPCLPVHARDAVMAASFVAAASVAYGDVAQELLDEDVPDVDFAAARARFCQSAETATTCLPLAAPLLPARAVTVDYLPYLRALVAADDLHEAAFDPDEAAAGLSSSSGLGGVFGRRGKTRASSKRYEREVELSEPALEAIRGMGFSAVAGG